MNIKQSSEGRNASQLGDSNTLEQVVEAVDKDTQTMQTTEIPVVGMEPVSTMRHRYQKCQKRERGLISSVKMKLNKKGL